MQALLRKNWKSPSRNHHNIHYHHHGQHHHWPPSLPTSDHNTTSWCASAPSLYTLSTTMATIISIMSIWIANISALHLDLMHNHHHQHWKDHPNISSTPLMIWATYKPCACDALCACNRTAHVLVMLCVHACVTSECLWLMGIQVHHTAAHASEKNHFFRPLLRRAEKRRRAGGSSAKAAS